MDVTSDDFDEFLQDAVMLIHDLWGRSGGRDLTSGELSRLNDLLDGFFGDVSGGEAPVDVAVETTVDP
jgi:hypothetical protein